ncbi:MAG: NUDIX domain-containing protein [Candidatus Microgenomates bacterium]
MFIIDFFKFCPNCKTKLDKKDNFIFCSNCAFYFYHNPSPTNAVIFYNSKKEVLLTQRKYPPKENFWDLPGGFAELKENIEKSIKREIKEELNIDINLKNLKYLTSTNDKYFFRKINQITLCFIFSYPIKNNEIKKIKTKDDVASIKFFSEDKIPWEKLAFNGVKKSLRLFFSSF